MSSAALLALAVALACSDSAAPDYRIAGEWGATIDSTGWIFLHLRQEEDTVDGGGLVFELDPGIEYRFQADGTSDAAGIQLVFAPLPGEGTTPVGSLTGRRRGAALAVTFRGPLCPDGCELSLTRIE